LATLATPLATRRCPPGIGGTGSVPPMKRSAVGGYGAGGGPLPFSQAVLTLDAPPTPREAPAAAATRPRASPPGARMTTFRDRLSQIQAEITEITAEHLEERIAAGDAPLIIDVRQRDEIADGRLDHAHVIPFG